MDGLVSLDKKTLGGGFKNDPVASSKGCNKDTKLCAKTLGEVGLGPK